IYYQFYETVDIAEALRQQTGIEAEAVTDIVFTHLHFDHCGAAVRTDADGRRRPAFPNAIHWTSRAQYDSERRPHPLEAQSFAKGNTGILEKAGLLRIIESTTQPYESMTLRLYDGHTLGQICAVIKPLEGETAVFPGDIIPLASHIVLDRISAYDLYPTLSYDGKTEILERAATEGHRLVFYHDAQTPASSIKKLRSTYKLK
ncbi:MAG: MBL fold metallo-hydrolase, partial [Tannerella sp.]|nr:MBL fold metallo-hydrolase [Tannerella sp.]